MKTQSYLLEIGCEEIPARFMPGLLAQLKSITESLLKQNRIDYETITSLGTYRRLTVRITGLPKTQASICEDLKGPPANIAKGPNGEWLPPAIGFAKRLGISPDALKIQTTSGGEYLVGQKKEAGKPVKTLLPQIVETLIGKLPLPIAMKWADRPATFIRPVHWVVSLLDKTVIPVTVFDAKAGRTTHGNRFFSEKASATFLGPEIRLSDQAEYEKELEKAHVMVAPEKRLRKIQSQLTPHIPETQIDPELLEEVTFLVEWPTALKGGYDKAFLNLPTAPLIECMRKHQKYFPVSKGTKLASNFIVVAEHVTAKNKANIIKGNEKVLKARLDDIRFFWDEDRKKTLAIHAKGLDGILYQKGLGSLADRVVRLHKLAELIAPKLNAEKQLPQIKTTVDLCKADLVTQMVYELPNLQGIMGRLYAQNEGIEEAIAHAIQDHYLPRFVGDKLPENTIAEVVSIADKIDTITASFYVGNIPSGSQDPWGVRRAIFGIFEILYRNNHSLNVEVVIKSSFALFGKDESNYGKCIEFIKSRAKSYLLEKGLEYDAVDAVLPGTLASFVSAASVASAIQTYRKSSPDQFKQLVDTAVRIKRLSPKSSPQKIDPKLFQEAAETLGYQSLQRLKTSFKANGQKKDPQKLLEIISNETPSLTQYFDDVLVMAKESDIKNNRLAFLSELNDMFSTLGDFEKIVV